MIEIADFEEVTRIRMSREVDGKPVYWVAAYLVDGLLVDTGCAHTADELVAALEGRRLDLVVNTHFHEGHVGADRAIMERFGVPVLAHRDSVPRIGLAPELNPYQEYVWGYPQPASVSTLGAQVDTAAYHFEVIETPGHSAGHVALFERAKGDFVAGGGELADGNARAADVQLGADAERDAGDDHVVVGMQANGDVVEGNHAHRREIDKADIADGHEGASCTGRR